METVDLHNNPKETRRERLQRIEQRHMQLGKILQSTIGVDPNEPISPSPPRENRDSAAVTAAANSYNSSTSRPPPPPPPSLDMWNNPIVISLQRQVEDLQLSLNASAEQREQLHRKAEALARNLVKALKERAAFEDEVKRLSACDSGNSRVSSEQRVLPQHQAPAQPPLPQERQEPQRTNANDAFASSLLKEKEEELQRCYREMDRLVSLGLRSRMDAILYGVNGSFAGSRDADAAAAQVTILSLQKETASLQESLRVCEAQRDSLIGELKLSAACLEALDERLSLSEQELLHARISLTREGAIAEDDEDVVAPAKLDNSSASARLVDEEVDPASLPLAARKQMARLAREVTALHTHLQQVADDQRVRNAFSKQTIAELTSHSSELQQQLSAVLQQLSDERRFAVATAEELQNERLATARVCKASNVVSQVISVSKTDMDEMLRLLDCDDEGEMIRPEFRRRCRRFVQQASRDYSAVAQLLMQLQILSKVGGGESGHHTSPSEIRPTTSTAPVDSQRAETGGAFILAPPAPMSRLPPTGPLPKQQQQPHHRTIPAPSPPNQSPLILDATRSASTLGWQRPPTPMEKSPSPDAPAKW